MDVMSGCSCAYGDNIKTGDSSEETNTWSLDTLWIMQLGMCATSEAALVLPIPEPPAIRSDRSTNGPAIGCNFLISE
ncbi:hypothetical protein DFA_08003 [Cavenderia fasciculata]|uniref:Uncharacterized protein n=1 Tax=Cavenderia fasciculata TaxID=261658 RepID=F4Q4L3_CACFS|nr:uncharacterized protein DFA_08003 [Cavenderia fasciculata]EGG17022.1 hypothetical protein DFA_08003 [Cavenderia fasciculata]|eukprot:XP_004355506.1 hypothetical protein DFA_08003 [Cavenderia fasciculata]